MILKTSAYINFSLLAKTSFYSKNSYKMSLKLFLKTFMSCLKTLHQQIFITVFRIKLSFFLSFS